MTSLLPQPVWAQQVEARVIRLRDRIPGVEEGSQQRIKGLVEGADELRSSDGWAFYLETNR